MRTASQPLLPTCLHKDVLAWLILLYIRGISTRLRFSLLYFTFHALQSFVFLLRIYLHCLLQGLVGEWAQVPLQSRHVLILPVVPYLVGRQSRSKIHAFIHTYIHTYIHIYIRTDLHTHTCIHTGVRTYIQEYLHTDTHACVATVSSPTLHLPLPY